MSDDEFDDDLLPDDLRPEPKGKAVPLKRTSEQEKALAKRTAQQELEAAEKARAVRLAQIVNLTIAGHSLADIGAAIGASPEEVDRMLQNDTQRYVRNQPSLRVYVRNYVSGKYNELLDAVWEEATDKNAKMKLEHQDRALRILDRMARLHGAEAPIQSEVKVEAAPEAVEKLVNALAAAQGVGYDASIFDVVDAEIVHDSAQAAEQAALDAGEAVGEYQDGDDEDGF